MITQDVPPAGSDNDDPAQPIGRVNMRAPGSDDFGSGWSPRAILIGVLALAIMLLTLLIVLPWALEPLPA